MADFNGEDLKGSRFDRVNLTRAEFRASDLTGARFVNADLHGAVLRGVELVDVSIDGYLANVTLNGVDVVPLVEAELDRRYPDRVKMRPVTPAGFQEAWNILERLWDATVRRARQLPPELLHVSVDDEWSFVETLRHLVMATEKWISRPVLRDQAPWHPLGLPCDDGPDGPDVPRDRSARPSLDTILDVRRDRMAHVREVVGGLTEESLVTPVEPPDGPSSRTVVVRDCLLCVFGEEWEHRLFAERDLAILEARMA